MSNYGHCNFTERLMHKSGFLSKLCRDMNKLVNFLKAAFFKLFSIYFGAVLRLFCCYFAAILQLFCGCFAAILKLFWRVFQVICKPICSNYFQATFYKPFTRQSSEVFLKALFPFPSNSAIHLHVFFFSIFVAQCCLI